MKKKFSCPECQCDIVEEVTEHVTVSYPIIQININEEDVEADYDDAINEGGELSRFQCSNCGFIIEASNLEELSKSEYMKSV
ncbi:MAG: hypothetical protein M0P71_00730 [Melioribacteraceae bacterium]|nr:hypothetical protein [Melioribacteraceae bacterium]